VKPNRITRLWAGLVAVSFALMAFRLWVAAITIFALALAVFLVGSIRARRRSPPTEATGTKEPFWKKFLLDLLATLSIVGLGLCFIPILAVSSGNMVYLPLVWIACVVAVPFSLVVQWRLMNGTFDLFTIAKTSFSLISVAVAFSAFYLIPENIRGDQDAFPWIIGGIALFAFFAIPRVGIWLQSRLFRQAKSESES